MRTTAKIIALLLVLVSLAGPSATAPVAASPAAETTASASTATSSVSTKPVLFYGDSILWQASGNVAFAFAQARQPVKVQAFGGTALCDWVPAIRTALAAKSKPSVVALSFSGNYVTPCTGAAGSTPGPKPGTTGFYAHNRAAMDQIRSAAAEAKVPVVWVTPPPLGSTSSDHLEVFESMAERRGFRIVDAGNAVTSNPDRFVSTMTCRSDEGAGRGCQSGRIRVRADDKVHFFVTKNGYSSGGRRWAEVTVRGVISR